MRTETYYDETLELHEYEDRHRYANQAKFVDGIPINPTLRIDFDDTPNELREVDEMNDWWGKPYILVETANDIPMLSQTWAAFEAMHQQYGWTLTETQANFEAKQLKAKAEFLEQFPEGKRYTLRCLDGGAHDRSTWRGEFANLVEAVKAAKARTG